MITHLYGDVIGIEAEVLVNPSNAKGYMGGLIAKYFHMKGVAESIHYLDPSIEKVSKKVLKSSIFKCGDVFHTGAGSLGFPKGILHAITMMKPGQSSNIHVVKVCLINLLHYCEINNITTVALPLLGTGTGKVNKDEVIRLYEEMLSDSKTHFKIVHFKS
ncbi:macro domain-containing protein [Lysinibacillus sp. UGB7]|uniref:macro domain-containing protein n=1 Tax=Lysinibacillus sp. UGB7 TaxID=3411039 RepID=UPI003B7A8A66